MGGGGGGGADRRPSLSLLLRLRWLSIFLRGGGGLSGWTLLHCFFLQLQGHQGGRSAGAVQISPEAGIWAWRFGRLGNPVVGWYELVDDI